MIWQWHNIQYYNKLFHCLRGQSGYIQLIELSLVNHRFHIFIVYDFSRMFSVIEY